MLSQQPRPWMCTHSRCLSKPRYWPPGRLLGPVWQVPNRALSEVLGTAVNGPGSCSLVAPREAEMGVALSATDPTPQGPRSKAPPDENSVGLRDRQPCWKASRATTSSGLPGHRARSRSRQPLGTLSPTPGPQTQAAQSLLPGSFWAKGPSLGKSCRHPVLPWTLPRPFHWGHCETVLDTSWPWSAGL